MFGIVETSPRTAFKSSPIRNNPLKNYNFDVHGLNLIYSLSLGSARVKNYGLKAYKYLTALKDVCTP